LWELNPSRALFWTSTPLLGAGVAFGYWVDEDCPKMMETTSTKQLVHYHIP
jgi:hypothetical protein